MRTQFVLRLILVVFSFFLFSCKQEIDLKNGDHQTSSAHQSQAGLSSQLTSSSCVEDLDDGSGYDTIPRPTILGYRLADHPYSLTNMQQAYTNLYGAANGITITHKYVRFKPSSPQQLSALEGLDLDLFDYPLDYDVVQEGDYYDDGVTPAEEIPWLYAVVDVSFTPPAGITYEVLEQIHIPTLAAVENEAFRITGNPVDSSDCNNTASSMEKIVPNVPQCPEGLHWDYSLRQCVENDCPAGYIWNGSQCVPSVPQPSPSRQPSGTITVFDNNLNVNRGIRNARIVAKRFLKIERTFTDNQGQFFLNKEFNKVHLLMKCKNDQATIRALRRARLWQMLFPVKVNFGKFRGALNNLTLNIAFNGDARSRGSRFWAAATAHNTVQEYRDFAAQQGVGAPTANLRVLLTNWRLQGVSGATPMYAKRFWQTLPSDFLTTFVIGSYSGVAGGLAALTMVLKSEIDVTVGYNLGGSDVTANSDRLSEVLFHEQTHAAHYNKVGDTWWANFVNSEVSEMIAGPAPYGRGNTSNSPIIALGESWAYHMGHFIADLKYGASSGQATEQNIVYTNGFPVVGLSSHLNLLEDFNPARTYDPFQWIPQGLYYDLIDNRNDVLFNRVLLDDQVLNYTNQQFFNALDSDINTLSNYRLRLLSENGNNQAAGVNTIFTFYGY